ncbi:MAG: hypothetical protein VYA30_11540 [Myxococcota bacterium]|nr:hypothetical protein [Myxococcota bacterium]
MIKQVIITSAHVNAVGLALSLREVGFGGAIVCLQHKLKQRSIASRFPEICSVRLITNPESDRLPALLSENYLPRETGVLFTDERYLASFQKDGQFRHFKGAGDRLAIAINKWQFYQFVESKNLAPVPLTVRSDADPFSVFSGPFRSRVWQSWSALKKQPRGRLIRHQSELDKWKAEIVTQQMNSTDWGYQEQLSSNPNDNVSVAGWHDSGTRQSLVTRRVSVASGLGWLIERIDDPADLVTQSHNILDALEFEGPFEMEYVLDPAAKIFRVIELNPRFWMQHRLFQHLTDHAPIRRFLGKRYSTTVRCDGPVNWLQTDVALTSPLLAARYLRNGILAHPIKGAVGNLIFNKLRAVSRTS